MTESQGNLKWILLALCAFALSLSATFFGLTKSQTPSFVKKQPSIIGREQKQQVVAFNHLKKRQTITTKEDVISNPFSPTKRELFNKTKMRDIENARKETEIKAAKDIRSNNDSLDNAIASIFQQANPRLSKEKSLQYAKIIVNASKEFDVNPFLIGGIVVVESTVKEKAISSSGAVGLMQVHWASHKKQLPRVFGAIRSQNDLMKPENNIRAGTWLLAQLGAGKKATSSVLRGYLGTQSEKYQKRVIHWKTRIKKEFEKAGQRV